MLETRYLKRRVGKGRSGQQWYVRVPVPRDLQGRFGGRTALERALKTADPREAQRRKHGIVAEFFDRFDRARLGSGLTSVEIEEIARLHFDELMLAIDRDPMDTFQFREELGLGGEAVLWTLLDELENEDWGRIESHVQKIARDRGVELTSEKYDELARAFLNAEIAALRCSLALHNGELPKRPAVFNMLAVDRVSLEVPTSIRPRLRKGDGPTLTEATDRYFADRTRDPSARWTHQTEVQYRASGRLFASSMRDAPVASVTKQDAARFLETIACLRPDYGKSASAKALPFDELLKRYKGEAGLSNATLNRHARALHGFFDWAHASGLFEEPNPFAGHWRSTGRSSRTGWQPFSMEELKALFGQPLLETPYERRVHPARHSPQTALMWVPAIALFSGLRADEICGLRTQDLREEGGILFFNVTEHEGRSVKSEAAIRRVPVHSALVAIGFGDYLRHVRERGHAYLFPGLKPGGPDGKRNWYLSKAFTTYRRRAGVDRDRVCFHSFRKNVVEALERARLHQSEVAQLIGHDRGFTFSTYSPRGLDLTSLQAVVEKITYRGIDLRHLRRPHLTSDS